ncbi:MAG: HAMP domain-containing sensor histidine kinase [bacterium]
MFKSLYAKLAAVLTALFGLVGLAFMLVTLFSIDMYQQEVNQKLNSHLAEQIVQERLLIQNGQVNEGALNEIFHMLMVINPSIEIYLLNTTGKILAFSAPPGKVKKKQVDLAPIHQWLEGNPTMPLLGDDPRHLDMQKAFTVARIPKKGELQGYLYVILGGETYDSVVQLLQRSHILRLSAWMIGASLLFALITGLLLFASLTGRLKRLANVMDAFRTGEQLSQINHTMMKDDRSTDEIGRLGLKFKQMAAHIEHQMDELVKSDIQRRELMANVSHDLRTPLATLQGYIETLLIKHDRLTEQERQDYLKIAIKHCEHLSKLVDRLLELAKLDSSEMKLVCEPFSLGELIQDVFQKFQLKIEEKEISVVSNIEKDVFFVNADIGLIERVLDNLIENTIRFTPQGGTVRLMLTPENGNIKVQISDTGPGIPEDELPQIFNRFYQFDKSRRVTPGHSGLGLAITKRILELHGRSIAVTSVIDQGTTFTFSLPA